MTFDPNSLGLATEVRLLLEVEIFLVCLCVPEQHLDCSANVLLLRCIQEAPESLGKIQTRMTRLGVIFISWNKNDGLISNNYDDADNGLICFIVFNSEYYSCASPEKGCDNVPSVFKLSCCRCHMDE